MSSDPGEHPAPRPATPPPGTPDAGSDAGSDATPITSLLAPSRLRPVEIDLRRVFWAGVVMWTVAGAVAGALALEGRVGGRTFVICVVGLVLGLLGVLWSRRRAARASRA